MFLDHTESEQAIQDAFAAFFAKESPAEVVRAAEPLGFCQTLWDKLCATGAAGMAMPSAWGGGDASLAELGLVVALAGAHLAPVPLVEHAVASRLVADLSRNRTQQPSQPRQQLEAFHAPALSQSALSQPTLSLLESLIDGSTIGTLALRPASEPEPAHNGSDNRSGATAIAKLLPAGAVAEIFLTLSQGSDSLSATPTNQLIATHSAPPWVSLPNTADLPIANRAVLATATQPTQSQPTATPPAATPPVASQPAAAPSTATQPTATPPSATPPAETASWSPNSSSHVLASGQQAVSCYARALSEWKALTAVALWGLGNRALELGVGYTLERRQFDRPIGSFQAIQHGLADVAVELEAANYLCQRALWMLDTDHPESATQSAMAFLFTAEAAQQATAAVLHYHGGYGYAEEYDIGLYHRRAKGWSLIYDDPANEYQRLARILL